jgi:hypothetical protein
MNIEIQRVISPRLVLAYARAIACACATGMHEDTARIEPVIRSMLQYSPSEPNFDVDCQPHRQVRNKHNLTVWAMPPWARHGVRYLNPGVDLFSLDPAIWCLEFMATVDRLIPELSPNERALFQMCERSMQFDIEDRQKMLDDRELLTDSARIRRAGIVF